MLKDWQLYVGFWIYALAEWGIFVDFKHRWRWSFCSKCDFKEQRVMDVGG
jgi:hypothetical protein